MLPDPLHSQIFGGETEPICRYNLQKCIQHLRRHDLLPQNIDTIYEVNKHLSTSTGADISLDIPNFEGCNIDEHFRSLGSRYSGGYKDLAYRMIEHGRKIVNSMPTEWVRTPGWTRYEPLDGGGFAISQEESPLENTLVFDVETCMSDSLSHSPTLAVAVSDKAWYSWTSPRLLANQQTESHKLSTKDLIPFTEAANKEKLVIGHNVSFDRSFLRDQYDLQDGKTKFLDTLSLHMCICGLTGLQRAVKVAHKRKLRDAEQEQQDPSLLEPSIESDAGIDDMTNNLWIEKSSLNNLADVYQFHCGSTISKDDREIFIEGTMDDVRENFQSLMTYCANDVKATFEVFEKLFPTFTQRFPHPVTLAGMLEMSTMYLPVNTNNWFKYIEKSQATYDEYEQRLSSSLQELANRACSMSEEEYSKDVWLWDVDWSKQTIKANKTKWNAWQKAQSKLENQEEKSIDEQVKEIYDTKSFMRQIMPFLPGFPKWYRDLCCPINKAPTLLGEKEWQPGPCLISTQMRITPKLMQLTWDGYPLHHDQKYGWGYLVPNDDLVAQYLGPPEGHPYEKFPIKQLRILCKDLPRSHILVEDTQSTNKDLEDDLVQKKIEELRDNTQMSTENLIKLLKKFSKKKKVTPRFKNEYCDEVDIPGAYFMRLPHKNGFNYNVGNPLGRDFLAKMEDGTLSSLDNNLAKLLLNHSSALSYWKNNQKRVKSQMVVALKNDHPVEDEYGDLGAILPRVIVAGTVTRRAVEPTWLTASNQDTTRIGSELKAMIQAPKGYCFVGADVDSQELWIASLMGDSFSYKIHGGTGLSYMTLRGSKSEKTDMHSKTASLIGISRSEAKVLNYARIYGAGQKFIERYLMNTNHQLTAEEAKEKAKKIYKETKGARKFKSKFNLFWDGGTESATFNKLEQIANSEKPKTPILDCQISQALEPDQDLAKDFATSRVNWVVQSSAVDFLHLLLVNMRWLFERLEINGRFSISIHDEVRYLVREEDKYKAAYALQISNLLVRAYFAYKLNMKDLPMSVAFFSSIDIDKCLRKEVDMDCKSPSNPQGLSDTYNIPHGESLDIKQLLKKYTYKGSSAIL